MSILTIPEDAYHRDELGTDQPSLSASIAHTLITRSPKHAWTEHPRLNPRFERKADEKYDLGNTVHAILLDQRPLEEVVHIVHQPSWRTNDAKEEREYARSVGRIPLLFEKAAEVKEMVDAIGEQLAEHGADPPVFQDGAAEQTLQWTDQPTGVECRARLDYLRHDLATCDDLKTTSRSANPDAYSKNLFSVGADVQAAFYLRGIEQVTGKRPEFRWCVVETMPPYALVIVSPDASILAIGNKKVERALELWRKCLAEDIWPGYPDRVCYAEAPAWIETQWYEQEARDAA